MKMQIGELARKAGCGIETIRYYEKEGLLRKPERSAGNYRLYGPEALERLRFIRHCRRHGMHLDGVRSLLAYRDGPPDADCAWVSGILDEHIGRLEEQICSLEALRVYLQKLRKQCGGGHPAGCCPIMQSLSNSALCVCEAEQPGNGDKEKKEAIHAPQPVL